MTDRPIWPGEEGDSTRGWVAGPPSAAEAGGDDVTTPAPGSSTGTMRETLPARAVDGNAMMGTPPCDRAAPRMKSSWPPKPL